MAAVIVPTMKPLVKALMRAINPFSPLSLFANGEQGAWYDPSDLTTLYQDDVGTTPVTTDGDPVGLMLDKSKGLVLGPELVTNGTFDTDTTGWGGARSNETLSVVGGRLRVTAVAAGAFGVSQLCIPSSGSLEAYKLTGLAAPGSQSLSLRVASTSDLPGGELDVYNTEQNFEAFRQSSVALYAGFIAVAANAGDFFEIDNISVKELPGNHATQSVAASRRLYRTDGTLHWLEFDGFDDELLIPEIFTGSQDRSIFLSYRGTGAGTTGQAPLVSFGGSIGTTGAGWQLHEESTLALRVGGNKLYTRTADLNDHVISNYWSTSLGSTTSSTAVARLDGSVLPTASESAEVINTGGGSGSVGSRQDGPYHYSMRLYGLIICRSIYAATTISSTEQYLATKSGVTL